MQDSVGTDVIDGCSVRNEALLSLDGRLGMATTTYIGHRSITFIRDVTVVAQIGKDIKVCLPFLGVTARI